MTDAIGEQWKKARITLSGSSVRRIVRPRQRLKTLRRAMWHARRRQFGDSLDLLLGDHFSRLRRRPSNGIPMWSMDQLNPRRHMRVAVIMDKFSQMALSPEWIQVAITPDNWRTELSRQPVDLLFVESAWSGNKGEWDYCITGTSAPRPVLVELVAWCRDNGVPTCFWNKEDPTHFEDFIDSAALMDWVFTTDSDCIPRYRERLGHDRVAALPFAVPTSMCSPVRRTGTVASRGVVFGGTWFRDKYPERREQMRLLFDATLEAIKGRDTKFDIYSRHLGGDDKYQFPAPYDSHVEGSLSYEEMLSAYRMHKVFLNVNTVTSSPTMFARRVLEITACGTPVVSTSNPALSTFLGAEGVAQVSTHEEAVTWVSNLLDDPECAARMVHLGQRQLWREHTYTHRVNTLLHHMGLGHFAVRAPSLTVVSSTNRPEQLNHLLENLARQTLGDVQVLLACHGFEAPRDLEDRARAADLSLTVVPVEKDWSLGQVLNHLITLADGDVVTKMDDDDHYGPHYLEDLLHALLFSRADIAGKGARYFHLQGSNKTVLLTPHTIHRNTMLVAGATIMGWRQVLRQVPFPDATRGEDTSLQQRIVDEGGRIYSADQYNFCATRRADPSSHTWNAEDELFLRAPICYDGLPLERIFL